MSDEPILKPEEVASVLDERAAGPDVVAARDEAAPESGTYSLREPLTIGREQLGAARKLAELMATRLAALFARDLEAEVRFEVDGFKQRRCSTVTEEMPGPAWIFSFRHTRGGGVALIVHPSIALSLVELALGGPGSAPESTRAPTPLEQRVMDKLAAAFLEPLARETRQSFASAGMTIGAVPKEIADAGETVGVAILRAQVAENEQCCMLAFTPTMLGATADVQRMAERPPGPLAAVLGGVTVEARPVLRAGRVALDELLALSPGDVLRFDCPLDERALDLRIQGEALFQGRIERQQEAAGFVVAWRRGTSSNQE